MNLSKYLWALFFCAFTLLTTPAVATESEAQEAQTSIKQVPSADEMGAIVANYNRLRPQLATGGSIDLAEVNSLKQKGFRTIIDLRTPKEGTAEEKAAVEAAGMRYVNLPVAAGVPSDALIAELGKVLEDASAAPVLLHCASGNRVGAVWAIYRTRRGVPLETALEEGRSAGMRDAREAQVRELLEAGDQSPCCS
ncbi:beta-lactamase hydrolase domain-containing protein [Microbulbifer harenosus]|uniref:Beta-lactamase hydrolase-like protein phosphatase-like domain-containing protein n=1 Tax=Microbulbifer harenosus TaxID=2576840 RepID=A0ABY2UFH7_9GAMM|nr:protein tyrosine phosphatase family protein [Microbulbifer harenosus]TLM76340.1 hypothetical protein FDY93_13195 [Microbulbifer harenosus]